MDWWGCDDRELDALVEQRKLGQIEIKQRLPSWLAKRLRQWANRGVSSDELDIEALNDKYVLSKQLIRDCIHLAARRGNWNSLSLLQLPVDLFDVQENSDVVEIENEVPSCDEPFLRLLFPRQHVRDALADTQSKQKVRPRHCWLERCLQSACLKGDVTTVVKLADRCRQELQLLSSESLPLLPQQLESILASITTILRESEALAMLDAVLGHTQLCEFRLPELAMTAATHGYNHLLTSLAVRGLVDLQQLLQDQRLWYNPLAVHHADETLGVIAQLHDANAWERCVMSGRPELFATRLRRYASPPLPTAYHTLSRLSHGSQRWATLLARACQLWGPKTASLHHWRYSKLALDLLLAMDQLNKESEEGHGIVVPEIVMIYIVQQSTRLTEWNA
eukprot:TRINITY_DN1188_c0_g1_i1.p1 TRINITY_DN1188_c0_g1~~TRINITY_DN1188_c0_g1_i1.p1  ORF type:complete len:412 (+),score=73.62 TRINITY_DN1188_c0_g1_i1:59-1237(+)